jgi:2-polyprenyl-6-methoxyphenol hydroxylase-like FAD-dependent oxidoreductase
LKTTNTVTMADDVAPQDSADRVVVIGAGCTGLALAQGLRKANIPVTVYERRSRDETASGRDWNMGTHWGIPELAELITEPMLGRLESVTVDPHKPVPEQDEIRFLKGDTGDLLFAAPTGKMYRLQRSRLRLLLSEGLDVRFDCTLSRMKYSDDGKYATAYFTNGQTATGRMVVGTDGASSAVRKCLLPHDAAQTDSIPYISTFVQSTYTSEQALFLRSFHPLYQGAIHPKGYFGFCGMQDVPDSNKPETWTFFFNVTMPIVATEQEIADSRTTKMLIRQLKELGAGFCEPWRSGIKWLDDSTCRIWTFDMGIWDPRDLRHQWDNHGGRVTLAGDSAHTMTVQRAQGLNHALRSARELRDAIAKFWTTEAQQQEAVDAYELSMKARAGEEVALSKANTELLHDWERFKQSALYKHNIDRTR